MNKFNEQDKRFSLNHRDLYSVVEEKDETGEMCFRVYVILRNKYGVEYMEMVPNFPRYRAPVGRRIAEKWIDENTWPHMSKDFLDSRMAQVYRSVDSWGVRRAIKEASDGVLGAISGEWLNINGDLHEYLTERFYREMKEFLDKGAM